MFIVIIFIIAVIGIYDTLSFGSFPDKRFERFGPLYIPPHKKQQIKKHDVPVPVDDSRRLTCKHCPFVHIGARLILLCIAFIQSGHA